MKVIAKKILVIHVALLVAEVLCAAAFLLELSRALAGNQLSWAYVAEWPILALYAIYVWHKLLNEEREGVPATAPVDLDDAPLRAYNDYLGRVHGSAREPEAHDS